MAAMHCLNCRTLRPVDRSLIGQHFRCDACGYEGVLTPRKAKANVTRVGALVTLLPRKHVTRSTTPNMTHQKVPRMDSEPDVELERSWTVLGWETIALGVLHVLGGIFLTSTEDFGRGSELRKAAGFITLVTIAFGISFFLAGIFCLERKAGAVVTAIFLSYLVLIDKVVTMVAVGPGGGFIAMLLVLAVIRRGHSHMSLRRKALQLEEVSSSNFECKSTLLRAGV